MRGMCFDKPHIKHTWCCCSGVGKRVSEDVTETLCLVISMAPNSSYEKTLVVTGEQKAVHLLGP